jgi:Transposase IS4
MIIAHHNMPNLDIYWEEPNYSLPHLMHPFFRPVMTRNRFSFLSQNIHLVNNMDDVGRDNLNRDPLFKLRWVVEKFNRRCKKVWQLGVHVSPDEGLVPTYSPNPIESFCPKPGGSYGVLIRFTCCAEKWFCYHIFVEDKVSRTLSEKLDLMLVGVKPGQICYIDRFYTTYDTVMHLHDRGFGVVGTCMANRFPPHPSVFKLPDDHVRGDYVACDKGPVVALLWHDSDVVHCLCNVHGAERATISRVVQDGSRRDVPGPLAMKMFGKYMQGGDRIDQMRSGHYSLSSHFRTSKWWLKAFLGIFDLALANSWILFKHTRLASSPTVSHAQFWLQLATALVAHQPSQLAGTVVPHSLRTFAPTDGPNGNIRKRPCCVVCSQHGTQGRSVYGCVTCRVALHPECDREWHHLANPKDMRDYKFDDWEHGE